MLYFAIISLENINFFTIIRIGRLNSVNLLNVSTLSNLSKLNISRMLPLSNHFYHSNPLVILRMTGKAYFLQDTVLIPLLCMSYSILIAAY